jgi:solute carrier family 45 protein 1/2/4
MVLAVTMFSTAFVQNYLGAIMLMAISGASWAVTTWVPFTLIGYDLARFSDAALSEELGVDTEEDGCHDTLRNGGIMGLHNMSMAAPQMVSALVASMLFSILSYFDVGDAFGWIIRAGGVAGLVAAFMIVQLDVGEEMALCPKSS